MNDTKHYQKKRESEKGKKSPREPMSDENFVLLIGLTSILMIVVALFVLQWKALESGRIECESQGGEWHSTSTGKVTITRCDGVDYGN